MLSPKPHTEKNHLCVCVCSFEHMSQVIRTSSAVCFDCRKLSHRQTYSICAGHSCCVLIKLERGKHFVSFALLVERITHSFGDFHGRALVWFSLKSNKSIDRVILSSLRYVVAIRFHKTPECMRIAFLGYSRPKSELCVWVKFWVFEMLAGIIMFGRDFHRNGAKLFVSFDINATQRIHELVDRRGKIGILCHVKWFFSGSFAISLSLYSILFPFRPPFCRCYAVDIVVVNKFEIADGETECTAQHTTHEYMSQPFVLLSLYFSCNGLLQLRVLMDICL